MVEQASDQARVRQQILAFPYEDLQNVWFSSGYVALEATEVVWECCYS